MSLAVPSCLPDHPKCLLPGSSRRRIRSQPPRKPLRNQANPRNHLCSFFKAVPQCSFYPLQCSPEASNESEVPARKPLLSPPDRWTHTSASSDSAVVETQFAMKRCYRTEMLFSGTSGWAYPTWKPEFYPAKLPATKYLSFYAGRLNSVEVNYTFRRLADESLFRKWIRDTPPQFRFAVKAHQAITHFRRLRDADESCSLFLASIEPLRAAGRLAPVLLQLPPDLKFDNDRLKYFLGCWPSDLRAAVEFRHESWFCEDVYRLLRRHNVALCQAATEALDTPIVVTADFSYLRYRKDDYTTPDREKLTARVSNLLSRGDTFVYFKHEDTPSGASWAENLLRAFPAA